MRKIHLDIISIALIVIVLSTLIFVYFLIKSEGGKCIKNPYVYGASKMGDVQCYCEQGKSVCPAKFNFNDTSFIAEVTKCSSGSNQYATIDIGKLNITVIP